MMYKLQKDPITGEVRSIQLIGELSVSIPKDPDNTDYQAYLKWLEEGNIPLEAE